MAKVIAAFSGVHSYTDGTKDQFAVSLNNRGKVSYTLRDESKKGGLKQALVEAKADSTNRLATLFGQLTGVTFNPAGSAAKTIKNATYNFRGRVTVDSPTKNNSWFDFDVVYTGKIYIVHTTNSTAWTQAKTAQLAYLNSMFTGLGVTFA